MTIDPPELQPADAGEALAAVRRAVIEPDELPRRVVAAAVYDNLDGAGPSVGALHSWGTERAAGPGARELSALVGALLGPVHPVAAAGAVVDRYGPAGVVGAVSIAALAVAEDLERIVPPGSGAVLPGHTPKLGHDLLGVSTQLTRAFGRIPMRWRRLSIQRSTVARWWALHDVTLVPASLVGEEKWLAMASLADTLGDRSLADLYAGFLLAQGWPVEAINEAMGGAQRRLRPGFARLLIAARRFAAGRLDVPRLTLAAADLPPGADREMLDLIRLVRALVVVGALVGPDGD